MQKPTRVPGQKFTELFIKTNIFPTDIAASIAMIFDYRQEADYDLDENITTEEAAHLINKSEEFYQLTMRYFEQLTNGVKWLWFRPLVCPV